MPGRAGTVQQEAAAARKNSSNCDNAARAARAINLKQADGN
jgi:hypothetical protein